MPIGVPPKSIPACLDSILISLNSIPSLQTALLHGLEDDDSDPRTGASGIPMTSRQLISICHQS